MPTPNEQPKPIAWLVHAEGDDVAGGSFWLREPSADEINEVSARARVQVVVTPVYANAVIDRLRAHAVTQANTEREAERRRCIDAALAWGDTHDPHVTVNARNAALKIARAMGA